MNGLMDNPYICAVTVVCAFVFVLCARSFYQILPYLFKALGRWKINMEIEDSLQLYRSRNLVAAVIFIPLCLIVYSYGLYSPSFFDGFSPPARLGLTAAALLAYVIVRAILNQLVERGPYHKEFLAANTCYRTYVIIIFLVIFLAGGVMSAFSCPDTIERLVLLSLTGLFYLIFVRRRGQIFASVCSPFATFLYLCCLELLPTAALVLTAVLL